MNSIRRNFHISEWNVCAKGKGEKSYAAALSKDVSEGVLVPGDVIYFETSRGILG